MSRLLSLLLMSALSLSTYAQTDTLRAADHMSNTQLEKLSRNSKIIYIDGKREPSEENHVRDSLIRRIQSFYYDQFRHYHDPNAPYFQFMSRDAQLTMGIGGAVRMRGYYDFKGMIPSPAFAPYMIPMNKNSQDDKQLGTTPAGTCLFFWMSGQSRAFGKYLLYIEANFNGYNARDFHLKKAYVQWREYTLGLAPSTFSDPASQTPMVDANGTANKVAPTNVLFRYMPVVRNRWVFAVSVEDPSSPAQLSTDDETCSKVHKWFPDFAAFAQYQWSKDEHVRLSGLYRLMTYRDLVNANKYNVSGWGVQLSTVAKPYRQLTLYGNFVYGHGYTSVLNDLMIGSYDLIPKPGEPGRMYSPGAFGWHVGAQWHFRPNLFACVAAGQVRYLPHYAVAPDEYKYGQIVTANVFWDPTPRTEFAIEYDWGRRVDKSGMRADAHRIGAVVQFSF